MPKVSSPVRCCLPQTYAAKSVTDTRSELGIRTDKSFAMQNGIVHAARPPCMGA
jgi:hypothetical protein